MRGVGALGKGPFWDLAAGLEGFTFRATIVIMLLEEVGREFQNENMLSKPREESEVGMRIVVMSLDQDERSCETLIC